MISYSLSLNDQLCLQPIPIASILKVTSDHNIDPAAIAALQESSTQGLLLIFIGQNCITPIAARQSREPNTKPFSNNGNILSVLFYVIAI